MIEPTHPLPPSLAVGIDADIDVDARRAPCPSDLLSAAAWLRARYHRHAALVDDGRGWSLRIALLPSDHAEGVTLEVREGRIHDIAPYRAGRDGDSELTAPAGDVVIRGCQSLLVDILRLRQSPSEPYLFGELGVDGPEADFLRLDYIVATLAQAEAQP
jgi:hypothetical protein